ncbi:rhamnogalacturonan lyase, partial [Bacillus atrophaeus]|nr:rhamnogalacturonan lyase [Bacillus atrophaeus]
MGRGCLMSMQKKSMLSIFTVLTLLLMIGASVFPAKAEGAARQLEALNRGLVAVKTESGVFISWRLLGTENASVSFNVYRNGQKLNASPIASSTNYLDKGGSTS